MATSCHCDLNLLQNYPLFFISTTSRRYERDRKVVEPIRASKKIITTKSDHHVECTKSISDSLKKSSSFQAYAAINRIKNKCEQIYTFSSSASRPIVSRLHSKRSCDEDRKPSLSMMAPNGDLEKLNKNHNHHCVLNEETNDSYRRNKLNLQHDYSYNKRIALLTLAIMSLLTCMANQGLVICDKVNTQQHHHHQQQHHQAKVSFAASLLNEAPKDLPANQSAIGGSQLHQPQQQREQMTNNNNLQQHSELTKDHQMAYENSPAVARSPERRSSNNDGALPELSRKNSLTNQLILLLSPLVNNGKQQQRSMWLHNHQQHNYQDMNDDGKLQNRNLIAAAAAAAAPCNDCNYQHSMGNNNDDLTGNLHNNHNNNNYLESPTPIQLMQPVTTTPITATLMAPNLFQSATPPTFADHRHQQQQHHAINSDEMELEAVADQHHLPTPNNNNNNNNPPWSAMTSLLETEQPAADLATAMSESNPSLVYSIKDTLDSGHAQQHPSSTTYYYEKQQQQHSNVPYVPPLQLMHLLDSKDYVTSPSDPWPIMVARNSVGNSFHQQQQLSPGENIINQLLPSVNSKQDNEIDNNGNNQHQQLKVYSRKLRSLYDSNKNQQQQQQQSSSSSSKLGLAKPRGVMWEMATDTSLGVTLLHMMDRASFALPLGFFLMPFIQMMRSPSGGGLSLARLLPARASHRSVDYEDLVKRIDYVDKLLSKALRPSHRAAIVGRRR